AMIAQRYMHDHEGTQDTLAAIATACRNHGAANPDAQLKLPLTRDMYDGSPWVVEPLRREDCCLVSDGAAAVVVMSAERAKKLGVKAPVPVRGFGQGNTSRDVQYREDLTETLAGVSAKTAFAMSGLNPSDI